MWTEEEKNFISYWEFNRKRKKKLIRQLAVGLPLSVALVLAIMANLFSGWYKRADTDLHNNSGQILVVMIAAIGIVIFVTVFSAKHKWDINEQRYLELMAKKPDDAEELQR